MMLELSLGAFARIAGFHVFLVPSLSAAAARQKPNALCDPKHPYIRYCCIKVPIYQALGCQSISHRIRSTWTLWVTIGAQPRTTLKSRAPAPSICRAWYLKPAYTLEDPSKPQVSMTPRSTRLQLNPRSFEDASVPRQTAGNNELGVSSSKCCISISECHEAFENDVGDTDGHMSYGQDSGLTKRTWILYKEFSRGLHASPIYVACYVHPKRCSIIHNIDCGSYESRGQSF